MDCMCGATHAHGYTGLWVQCDACGAWLHGACIGFPRRGPPGEVPALAYLLEGFAACKGHSSGLVCAGESAYGTHAYVYLQVCT